MTPADVEKVLLGAAASDAEVTIKKKDGRVFVGVPVFTDGLVLKVATGKRGRPAVMHVDDVEEVLP